MKIKFYILTFSLFLCFSGRSQTTPVTSFDNLMTSLNAGVRVRVVIHYARCERYPAQSDQSSVPDAITGMDIDTYEYFAEGAVHNKVAFVVFATSKLIQNPLGKGFVLNYGKLRINADNSVIVTAKYIHPKTFKVLMDESFGCKLNNGTDNEGIHLFK